MRINVKEKFSRLLTREYISKLSRLMRMKYIRVALCVR